MTNQHTIALAIATLVGVAGIFVATSDAATVTQGRDGTYTGTSTQTVVSADSVRKDGQTGDVRCSQSARGAVWHLPGNPDGGVQADNCATVETVPADYCGTGPGSIPCRDSNGNIPGAVGEGLPYYYGMWSPSGDVLTYGNLQQSAGQGSLILNLPTIGAGNAGWTLKGSEPGHYLISYFFQYATETGSNVGQLYYVGPPSLGNSLTVGKWASVDRGIGFLTNQLGPMKLGYYNSGGGYSEWITMLPNAGRTAAGAVGILTAEPREALALDVNGLVAAKNLMYAGENVRLTGVIATSTATGTATYTANYTAAASGTATGTASSLQTGTWTGTYFVTQTGTWTGTGTETTTGTATGTLSGSSSGTGTATWTGTWTGCAPFVATLTRTRTVTTTTTGTVTQGGYVYPLEAANVTVDVTGVNTDSRTNLVAGTLTAPKVPVVSAAHTLIDGTMQDDHAGHVAVGQAVDATKALAVAAAGTDVSGANPLDVRNVSGVLVEQAGGPTYSGAVGFLGSHGALSAGLLTWRIATWGTLACLATRPTSSGAGHWYDLYRGLCQWPDGRISIGKATAAAAMLDVAGGVYASGESHFGLGTYFDPGAGVYSAVKLYADASAIPGGGNSGAPFTAGITGAAPSGKHTYGGYFSNSSTVSGGGYKYGLYSTGADYEYLAGSLWLNSLANHTGQFLKLSNAAGVVTYGMPTAADVGALPTPSMTTNYIPYWNGTTFVDSLVYQSGNWLYYNAAGVLGGVGEEQHAYSAGPYGNRAYYYHSNSNTMGAMATTTANQEFHNMLFSGVNGSGAYASAAQIRAYQAATAGATYVPGVLSFSVGSASAGLAEVLHLETGASVLTGHATLDLEANGASGTGCTKIDSSSGKVTTCGTASPADIGALATPSLTTGIVPYWTGSAFADGPGYRYSDYSLKLGSALVAHSGAAGNDVLGFGYSPESGQAVAAGKPGGWRHVPSTGEMRMEIDATTRAPNDSVSMTTVQSCTAAGCTVTGHATADLQGNAVSCTGKTKVNATNGQITSCTDAAPSDIGAQSTVVSGGAHNDSIVYTDGGYGQVNVITYPVSVSSTTVLTVVASASATSNTGGTANCGLLLYVGETVIGPPYGIFGGTTSTQTRTALAINGMHTLSAGSYNVYLKLASSQEGTVCTVGMHESYMSLQLF